MNAKTLELTDDPLWDIRMLMVALRNRGWTLQRLATNELPVELIGPSFKPRSFDEFWRTVAAVIPILDDLGLPAICIKCIRCYEHYHDSNVDIVVDPRAWARTVRELSAFAWRRPHGWERLEQAVVERRKLKLHPGERGLLPVHIYGGVAWGYQADLGLLRSANGDPDLDQLKEFKVGDIAPALPSSEAERRFYHPFGAAELVLQGAHITYENFRMTLGEAIHISWLVKRSDFDPDYASKLAALHGSSVAVSLVQGFADSLVLDLSKLDPRRAPFPLPMSSLRACFSERSADQRAHGRPASALVEGVTSNGSLLARRAIRFARRRRRGYEDRRAVADSRPRVPLIAFTGPDGAGKSAQIKLLFDALRARGWRVAIVHQYEPVTAVARGLKTRFRGVDARLQSRFTSPGATAVRARTSLVPLDGVGEGLEVGGRSLIGPALAAWWLLAGCWRALAHRHSARNLDALISDRCYIDEIVRVEWKLDRGGELGEALLRRLPPPDIVFYLQIGQELGWSRKKAQNTSALGYRRKRVAIERITEDAGTHWPIVRIDVDERTPQDVASEILDKVERLVGVVDAS